MIKKYKQFNEGLLDKLTGPSKEEFFKNKGFEKSFETGDEFLDYIIVNLERVELPAKDHWNYQNMEIPNKTYFKYNGVIYFEYNNKSNKIYFSEENIHEILKDVFNLSYVDIMKLIRTKFKDKYNIDPIRIENRSNLMWL